MRLKKCALSFLRKLVRVEMSLMSVMSDGSAFQARGPATEKAFKLSVTMLNLNRFCKCFVLMRTVYPRKWLPDSCRSSAGE